MEKRSELLIFYSPSVNVLVLLLQVEVGNKTTVCHEEGMVVADGIIVIAISIIIFCIQQWTLH